MVKLDIHIRAKEIVAMAVSIPLIYERIRKVKLKYDIKEIRWGIKECMRAEKEGPISEIR